MSSHLDALDLPVSWPAALRERSEICRGVRADPILKTLVEAAIVQKCTGWGGAANDLIATRYIEKRLGAEGLREYLSTDYSPKAEQIAWLAEKVWCFSPLATALTLSRDLNQDWSPSNHIRVISDAIVEAINGTGPRTVLISVPSRYGKSDVGARRTLVSFFCLWPGWPAIYVSASQELAERMGRLVRNDLDLHSERTGVALAPDSRAAGYFSTQIEGGELRAAGVGGTIGGFGASCLVCDDLFRSSVQADSASYRAQVVDTWVSTLQPRQRSGALCIVIGTRFHRADLIGVLRDGDAELGLEPIECREVRLPALGDHSSGLDEVGRLPGEALPLGPVMVQGFGYSKEELEQRRASSGLDSWLTNYQQNPAAVEKALRAYRFDEKLHVRESPFDPSLPLRVSLDFNIGTFAIVWGQCSEEILNPKQWLLQNKRWFTLAIQGELFTEGHTSEVAEMLAEKLSRFAARVGRLKIRVTGDASGGARKTAADPSAPDDWAVFKRTLGKFSHLFETRYELRRSNLTQRQRVAAVNELLRPAEGRARLVIDPSCRALIRDLTEVSWSKDNFGNVQDSLSKKNPVLTHASDALGYMVVSVTGGTGSGFLRERPA